MKLPETMERFKRALRERYCAGKSVEVVALQAELVIDETDTRVVFVRYTVIMDDGERFTIDAPETRHRVRTIMDDASMN